MLAMQEFPFEVGKGVPTNKYTGLSEKTTTPHNKNSISFESTTANFTD